MTMLGPILRDILSRVAVDRQEDRMPDCITLTAPEYDALEDEMRDTIVWELRHTLWAPGTMVVLSVPIRRYPPREAVIDSGSH